MAEKNRSAPARPKKTDDQKRILPDGEMRIRPGSFIVIIGRRVTCGGLGGFEGGEGKIWHVGAICPFRCNIISCYSEITLVSYIMSPNKDVQRRRHPCVAGTLLKSSDICVFPCIYKIA